MSPPNITTSHILIALPPLRSSYPDILLPTSPFLLSLTNFILIHKNFSLNMLHRLQDKGTTIGKRMIPSYINLFIGSLVELDINKKTA